MCRKITVLVVGIVAALLLADASVFAAETNDNEKNLRYEILDLKHQVERLEKSRGAHGAEKANAHGCCPQVLLHGLMEFELGYAALAGRNTSDLRVSTAELAADLPFAPGVLAHALLLFEEDDTEPPELDEVLVTFTPPAMPALSLAVGRLYLPFGHFDSRLVSDPLTLEIGEMRETALQVGFRSAPFHASLYMFNGDTGKGTDRIGDYGFSFGAQRPATAMHPGYDLGIGWINNLADSDGLQAAVAQPADLHTFASGLAFHATGEYGRWLLITEYVGAAKAFDAADLAFAGSGAQVAAWNLEIDCHLHLWNRKAIVAVAWQQSREAAVLGLPRLRQLIAVSTKLQPHASLAVELAHDKDYELGDGGRGDSGEVITAQLALVF